MDVYSRIHVRTGVLASQVDFSLRRSVVLIVLAVLAAVVGVVVYSAYDPSTSQLFPKCIFKSLTGYDCPGCGSQRAIHSLLHGDIAAAFGYNAMLVCSIPYLILLIYAELFRKKVPRLHTALTSVTAVLIILALVILWWVGRNIFHV